MSLDLSRPAPDSRARDAGRRLSALPISVLVHVLVVLALVVIPLLATEVLPQPPLEILEWTPAAPVPPSPPPPARPPSSSSAPPQPVSSVPFEAPSQILPYDGVDRGVPIVEQSFTRGVVDGIIASEAGLAPAFSDTPPAPPPPAPVRLSSLKEPKRLVYVAPSYPDVARMAKVEGTVILEAIISPDGTVRDVRVLRSVGLLDEAAMAAVRQWRYTPTLLSGVPVPVVMTVTVTFRLQ